jgi:hypothetical protein
VLAGRRQESASFERVLGAFNQGWCSSVNNWLPSLNVISCGISEASFRRYHQRSHVTKRSTIFLSGQVGSNGWRYGARARHAGHAVRAVAPSINSCQAHYLQLIFPQRYLTTQITLDAIHSLVSIHTPQRCDRTFSRTEPFAATILLHSFQMSRLS